MAIPVRNRGKTFWILQVTGWSLLIYLIYAQGITAFDYDLGVAMGTQEPVEAVTEVGASFWYGFAFSDLLTYIPILLIGLLGHLRSTEWGQTWMAAALGISVYWPIVCLATLVDVRGTPGWNIAEETQYWIVLPIIALWGVWGLFAISRMPRQASTSEAKPGVLKTN